VRSADPLQVVEKVELFQQPAHEIAGVYFWVKNYAKKAGKP
jgi:hypothetical protein